MHRRFSWVHVTVAIATGAIGLAAGCNLVTGADALQVGNGDDGGGANGGASTNSNGVAQGGAQQGAGGVGNSPAGPGSGGQQVGSGPNPNDSAPVDGVSIDSIALYQAVKRPLMANGNAVNTGVDIVANRPGLLRVFYTADGGYNGQPVFARLSVEGQDPMEVQATPSVSSSEGSLGSTINFDIPRDFITPGAGYRVDLVQAAAATSGSNTSAVYPATGFQPMNAEATGVLKVVLVPIAYNADGSGRVSSTSAAQLKIYEDMMYAMYPVSDIDVTVRSSNMSWNSTVSAGGSGWSALLDAVQSLRNSDGASFETYYYGIFDPATSFQQFCSGGCTAGLGFVIGANDASFRAAIGLGFAGEAAAEHFVHELGHNHGRPHAPCGPVSGADPNFPHSGGGVGVWGYDIVKGGLKDLGHKDLMGYCDPPWVSDYQFQNFFNRNEAVSGAASWYVPEEWRNRTWKRASIAPDGTLTWRTDMTLERPPGGEMVNVTVETTAGQEQVSASFIPYDHIDGGVLMFPPTNAPVVSGGSVAAQFRGYNVQSIMP